MSTVYFAYGSNLDVAQMRERCPNARLLGPALLWGWRFRIGAAGYATVVPQSAAVVHGVLWELTESDETALDDYEGVSENLYQKVYLEVEHALEAPATAMVYLASDDQPGGPRSEYLDQVLASAQAHGFPEEYCAELSEWR
jgi:gamma-glutamylcyclotransferase (GGCT)/AIG2-like uncharacterized protein YtfP